MVGRIDSTMIASHFDGSKKAYLDWICVIKSYRHLGIAQRLLETLREILKNNNINTLIALTASNEAVKLSEKFTDTKQEQVLPPEPKPLPKAQKQADQKTPPEPTMTAEAAAYLKLQKSYKELVRQNETIFVAEKERNALEEKQGNLKGLSKLTKKGELQREIDRINERINLLKVGLSGIAKRYGYQTVQDFYRAYHAAKNAYADYQEKVTKWEKVNGKITHKSKKESLHEQLQNYQRDESARQSEQTTRKKDRGAR